MSLTEYCHQQEYGDPGMDFLPGTPDAFFPRIPELRLSVSLPPTDNACHATGNGRRYATDKYKAWLRLENPRLLALLGEWEPDYVRWWSVEIRLWMPILRKNAKRADPQNYTKALLDLLTGTREKRYGERNAQGETITGDGLIKPGALWADDNQVRTCRHHVVTLDAEAPGALMLVTPAEAPMRETRQAPRRGRGLA